MSTATLPLAFFVPVQTRSETNMREHWSDRYRRSRAQKRTVGGVLAVEGVLHTPPPPPVVVTLTRMGGRRLDDDNLRGALKYVRDALAEWLGVDDRDPRVAWRYDQLAVMDAEGVGVRVEAAPAAGVGRDGR